MSHPEALIQRIKSEFREMPGLCLTLAQASRLFGLSEDLCERILLSLVDDGVLQRTEHYFGIWRSEFVGTNVIGHANRGR
jgi:hypothetical protein